MILRLSNEQWKLIEPLTHKVSNLETRGRKRKNEKHVFEMCLFMFVFRNTSGYTWRDLNYSGAPSYQTCNRRYLEWSNCDFFFRAIEVLAKDLESRGKTKLRSCFMDELYAMGYYFVLDFDYRLIDENDWVSCTKDFFESIHVWRLLLQSESKWISTRLPDDLYERVNCI